MNIDDNLINHLSNLAKLSFEGDNREALKKDLEKIIGFMNQLNTLETTNVEPLVFMTDEVNRLRVDEAHLEISKNDLLLVKKLYVSKKNIYLYKNRNRYFIINVNTMTNVISSIVQVYN